MSELKRYRIKKGNVIDAIKSIETYIDISAFKSQEKAKKWLHKKGLNKNDYTLLEFKILAVDWDTSEEHKNLDNERIITV